MTRYVKDTVANAPATNNIPLIQIETKTAQINDVIEYNIGERLKEDFGVEVSGVDISAIEIDKTSPGYRQLMSVTKDVVGATVKAEAEAKIKDIAAKQRIEERHYEESLRIQREESQYAQRMQTRSSNLSAYQVEKQAEVGVAGAEALGKMGSNGAGSIDLGGNNGSMGFNPAAMMASMAVGGVVGQNIAGAMGSAMSGMHQSVQQGAVPPPIPNVTYHLAVNGQATGPYNLAVLQQMATQGQFNAESLVWKNGMAEWAKAGTIDELKSMFVVIPPIPPTV